MKKKLKLNDLKVSSFTTDLKKSNADTVKGGVPAPIHSWKWCNTQWCSQYNACESQFFICETRDIRTCGGGDTEPPVC